ncbi:MAG: alpha/beta hydrolase [Rhodospirillales bacterium]|nr:alpha/beta hydrolase [Acetobacter sp.]
MPSLRDPLLHITDPDLRPFLQQWDLRGGTAPFSADEKRDAYLAGVARFGPAQAVPETWDRTITGPGGPIPLRIYQPRSDRSEPLPVLVYLHGGGFISGGLDTHDPVCRTLAHQIPAVVVAVQYRLAPEFPYPAAHEDAYAALCFAQREADDWGGHPDELYVAGDSAGGLLAAAVTLRAKREAGPSIRRQVLIYPMLDATMSSPSLVSNGLIPPFTLLDCVHVWQQYLGSFHDRQNEQVSPLLASDLSGLPATLVVTAGLDILRDEGKTFAERLQHSGVPVQWREYPSMVHGFFQWYGTVQAARSAMDDVVNFLQSSC